MSQEMPIISVTGTKGKTTVVSLLAAILQRTDHNVLHVNTTGHFMNGARQSTIEDSRRIWGYKTPTIAPGRYLAEVLRHPDLHHMTAVLECSFACAWHGRGYRHHQVGVFLNVFDDHIDASGRITSREELAAAKSFVFSAVSNNGWAVFNADDPWVCASLDKLPDDGKVSLVPCGVTFAHFALEEHLRAGGVAMTVQDNQIVLLRSQGQDILCDLHKLPFTFNGSFMPSVWNMLHVCGALYGFYDGILPSDIREVLEATTLASDMGRLVVMHAEKGTTVLADYAHETVSLKAIAKLAHTLTGEGGQVIGVVRLNHERSDELLQETGRAIADSFDQFIIYDKIDGYLRQPVTSTLKLYPQVVGRTSEILTAAIQEKNPQVTRIIREDEAIERAASIAGPADVVVVIVNDDIERSIHFIRKSFKVAEADLG